MSNYHTPVLLEEAIELLDIKEDGIYADLTFGGGGHSRRILESLGKNGHLYSFDQDSDTKANAPDDSRFNYVESNFRFLRSALRLRGVTEVDGILADLGVSSHHFDALPRGFSFRGEAPLDMRMNQRGGETAADVVNNRTEEQLATILSQYGELDTTWKIAACIARARAVKPITTTAELVAAVAPCTPKKDESKFLTKLFQALRIEVNGEMEALKMALEQSLKVLRPGLELGEIKKDRFEPAHALALWLESCDAVQDYSSGSKEASAYLHGEVVPSQMRGWCLVSLDGYSIGWGKGDGKVLKNHYPKGLRR